MNDNNVSILDVSTFLVSRPMEISTPDLIKHMACSERYALLVELEAHQGTPLEVLSTDATDYYAQHFRVPPHTRFTRTLQFLLSDAGLLETAS